MIVADVVNKYLKNISITNVKTSREYNKRLRYFATFVQAQYKLNLDELIKTMTVPGKGPKIDVYDLLSSYVSYLHNSGRVSPVTVKGWVIVVRGFLEYWDIEISPRKFKLRVRLPRVVRQEKEAATKEDIMTILNGCSSIKLKTYVLFLAATGCRASEALSTRLKDYDFIKKTVFIRGEFTKTKTDRIVFLTDELVAQVKDWLKFKYRTRRIALRNHDRVVVVTRSPEEDNNDFVFSSDFSEHKPSVGGLYITMLADFDKTLDRLGGKYAEFETAMKRRRRITFHSMRRYVKSTISDLGYGDYSEWFIGHAGSTYYRKSFKEKAELFQKIQPYLTYLDVASLERKGADIQSQVELLQAENARLKQRENKLDKEMQAIKQKTDKMNDMIGNIDKWKKHMGLKS